MSSSKAWHLHCDSLGCEHRFVPSAESATHRISDTREAAGRSGWTWAFMPNPKGQGPGWYVDYCPSCSVQRAAVAEVA